MKPSKRPAITTARTMLRIGRREDIPGIAGFFRENAAHLGRMETPRPPQWHEPEYWEKTQLPLYEKEYREGSSCRLFIFPADGGTIIGYLNFFAFIRGAFHACICGYGLAEAQQGKGVMTEAMGAACQFVFSELHMHRIMANVRPDNERSLRVLERLGFEREGYAKKYLRANGVWCDHVLTALTNDSWTEPPLSEGSLV